MKRILTILSVLLVVGGTAYAQESMPQDANTWANEWKQENIGEFLMKILEICGTLPVGSQVSE